MTARLASGRKVMPYLIEGQARPGFDDLGFNTAGLGAARAGMIAVTEAPWGTAHRLGGLGLGDLKMAGKTGTGQVRRITKIERDDRVRKNNELPWALRDHALFVTYAPADAPRYAVAVVVEHGGGGSVAAAPPARDILRELLKEDPATMARLSATDATTKGPAT